MQRTFTFEPVTARFFRISFKTPPPQEGPVHSHDARSAPPGSFQPAGIRIAEINLHSVPRVNRFEDKAGFSSASGLYALATTPVSAEDAVNKSEIFDLTSKMHPDGTLEWTPPEGRWDNHPVWLFSDRSSEFTCFS